MTGHDAGGGVLARLIPMFGHRSKLEEGEDRLMRTTLKALPHSKAWQAA